MSDPNAMPRLKRVRMKLDRAEEHLASLNTEFAALMAANRYGVLPRPDMHDGIEVFRVQIPPDEPRILYRLSILVGDYVSCLRATLDHLAWALSLLTTEMPFDKTEFPIFLEPNPVRVRNKIPDVPREAQEVIESLQPYHAGDQASAHHLAILYRLSNIEKHRYIPVIRYAFRLTGTVPPKTTIGFRVVPALDEGTEIATLSTVGVLNPEATVEISPTFYIVFGDSRWGAGMDLTRIGELHEFIRDHVFPRLCPFIEQAAHQHSGSPSVLQSRDDCQNA
jgi:hypothetical protein